MKLTVTKSGQYQLVGQIVAPGTDWAVADDNAAIPIPEELNALNLTDVRLKVLTAGNYSGTASVQLSRKRASTEVDMLSTNLTLDIGELDSDDAAAAYAISASNDDVLEGDILLVDIDVIHTATAAKGMVMWLTFG